MNAHQRKKACIRAHYQWPLGAKVRVRHRHLGILEGSISKHGRDMQNCCWVDFHPVLVNGRYSAIVPLKYLELLDPSVRGQRPWFKKAPWSGRS